LSSRRYKNFNEYIEAVKELITSYDDVIAVAGLEEFEVTLNERFIQGTIIFIDGSRLHFLEYIRITNNIPINSSTGTIMRMLRETWYLDMITLRIIGISQHSLTINM
jgi:hypothetical protein